MTLRDTARRLKDRAADAAHRVGDRLESRRRKGRAKKLFNDAKPVLKSAAPLLATVAVEEFLRRWRGANRKKAVRQEIAPALMGLAAAAASNPQVRKIVKDAIDNALPRLEALVEKAKGAKNGAKEALQEKVEEVAAKLDGEES